jgi:hypothetical protein
MKVAEGQCNQMKVEKIKNHWRKNTHFWLRLFRVAVHAFSRRSPGKSVYCNRSKSRSFARIFSPRSLRLCANLGKRGIRLRLAALYCNPSESLIPAKIFSRRGAETQRKPGLAFFLGLSLRLCASARDVPSARFWLRRAALGLLSLFAPNQVKCLSVNHLQRNRASPDERQPGLIRPDQA